MLKFIQHNKEIHLLAQNFAAQVLKTRMHSRLIVMAVMNPGTLYRVGTMLSVQ
jgi:hypothetical protein